MPWRVKLDAEGIEARRGMSDGDIHGEGIVGGHQTGVEAMVPEKIEGVIDQRV